MTRLYRVREPRCAAPSALSHVLAAVGPPELQRTAPGLRVRDWRSSSPSDQCTVLVCSGNVVDLTVFQARPDLHLWLWLTRWCVQILRNEGVSEQAIVFVCVLAAREGVQNILSTFPGVRVVTAAVDPDVERHSHPAIAPGCGIFLDRYYDSEVVFGRLI